MVFGGIMAGLILLCALVPFLGIFMPVPLVLVYVRYGGKTAVMTAIVSALLTAMFAGPVQAFLLTVPMGILPGLAFGYGFRHKLRPLLIVVIATVVFFASWTANYAVTRALVLGGRDPIADMVETEPIKSTIDQFWGTIEQVGEQQQPANEQQAKAKADNLATIKQFRSNPTAMVWALLPSSLLLGGIFNTWINYMLCRATLPRFGHDVPAPTPFSRFTLPAWTSWVFVLSTAGSLYFARSLLDTTWWVKLILNVATPVQFIFFIYGLAVVYGYLRIRQNMGKASSMALSLAPMLLLGLTAPQMYAMVGVADTVFDLRGLGHGIWKTRPPEETP